MEIFLVKFVKFFILACVLYMVIYGTYIYCKQDKEFEQLYK